MKNKEKYNLNKLEIKLIDTFSGYKIKVFYKDKIIYERTHLVDNDNKKIEGFFNWLEQEYKPPILDEKEKEYLSAVIKPFRKKVKYIEKRFWTPNLEYLSIRLKNNEFFAFPNFKKGKMYKGMEHDKYYTLEELGL